jgi:hypothetical protein
MRRDDYPERIELPRSEASAGRSGIGAPPSLPDAPAKTP